MSNCTSRRSISCLLKIYNKFKPSLLTKNHQNVSVQCYMQRELTLCHSKCQSCIIFHNRINLPYKKHQRTITQCIDSSRTLFRLTPHMWLREQRYYSTSSPGSLVPPWRVLFMGSDEFALVHLKALHQNMTNSNTDTVIKSLEVVAAKQRRSNVKKYCREGGITLHEWPLRTMTDRYDVGVVASFGNLIPERIINMFPFGIINVHPSLLPRYRGGAPISHTILNGDRETGISIMEIKPKRFDVGPILLQEKYEVPRHCSMLQLQEKLAKEGAKLLMQTLGNLSEMKVGAKSQENAGSVSAPILKLDISNANWEVDMAEEIERQFYAVHEMFDFRSRFKDLNVRFYDIIPQQVMKEEGLLDRISAVYQDDNALHGEPYFSKKSAALCVRCKDGWVGFKSVYVKKHMSASDFYHGYLKKAEYKGAIFESLPNMLDKYMLSKQT